MLSRDNKYMIVKAICPKCGRLTPLIGKTKVWDNLAKWHLEDAFICINDSCKNEFFIDETRDNGEEMNLIIKNEDRLGLKGFRVGWRIICKNGEPHDQMWGSVQNQGILNDLIAECEAECKQEHKNLNIIDERTETGYGCNRCQYTWEGNSSLCPICGQTYTHKRRW